LSALAKKASGAPLGKVTRALPVLSSTTWKACGEKPAAKQVDVNKKANPARIFFIKSKGILSKSVPTKPVARDVRVTQRHFFYFCNVSPVSFNIPGHR
jgi:hypothetical protein